jgi:CRISPR-associated DxTHG motif protein
MPERVGLAFLGTGDYTVTRYTWGDTEVETPFVQVALQEAFTLDRFIVAMTEEAQEANGRAIAEHIDLTPLTIPTGNDEAEWWTVFQTIVDAIPHQAQLTIDVTHGFRSQPLIALSIAVYLQAATDVRVERIVYGSYRGAHKEAPILDLTPFLQLIEWSVAARQFLRNGSADQLARLLTDIQAEAYRSDAEVKPQYASGAANQLRLLTEALAVVRPQEVAERRSGPLAEVLQNVQEDAQRIPQLRPLTVLLQQIKERIAPMEAPSLFDERGFSAQAEMMRFIVQTGQLQQAITLAREAMVSFQAVQMGRSPQPIPKSDHRESGRDVAATRLNQLAKTAQEGKKKLGAKEQQITDLWAKLGECRNDINHAGMNADPAPGSTLAKNTRQIVLAVADYVTASSS